MLQKVIVQNFVYFRERQTLELKNGPYFLIGENDSGKSSFFELIRQCMGITKITSLTKPYDPQKPSIVICYFLINNTENEQEHVVSIFMRPSKEDSKGDLYIKIALVRSTHEKEPKVGVDAVEERDGRLCWKAVENDELTGELQRIDNKLFTDPDTFLKLVIPHVKSTSVPNGNVSSDSTECETLLKQYVNKLTVVTFPFRGISPCQWTKSKRLKHDKKEENVSETYMKEEIVSWYLKNCKEGRILTEESALEQKFFELITNNHDIQFKFDEGTESIYAENKAFQDPRPHLLNISEGFYEAKKISIMLAVKQFKTVCLEEPDRGMHPEMIIRCRNLVLTQITDKVILLTSHHPSFLSPATFPKVCYFRTSMDGDMRKTTIISTNDMVEGTDDKTVRLFTSGQSSLMFFANRLFLVEGDGDFIFMTELIHFLLTHDDVLKQYIRLASSREQELHFEAVRQFLCSLHVLSMTGEPNKHRYRDFCSKLKLPCYFLMDKDALTENNPGQTDASPRFFLQRFNIKYDEEFCDSVSNDVSVLEDHGIFFWNAGKIEDAVVALASNNEGLKNFLRENKVFLKYKPRDKDVNVDTKTSVNVTGNPGLSEPYFTEEHANSKDAKAKHLREETSSTSFQDTGVKGGPSEQSLSSTNTTDIDKTVTPEGRKEKEGKRNGNKDDKTLQQAVGKYTRANVDSASTLVENSPSQTTSSIDHTEAPGKNNRDERKGNKDDKTDIDFGKDSPGTKTTETGIHIDVKKKKKRRRNNRKNANKKIFSNCELKNQNVINVIEKIADISLTDVGSEFRRLILFLMKMHQSSLR